MIRLPRVAAVGGAVLALAGSTFAAGQLAGRAKAPAAATVTIASSAPLFSAGGLVGGERLERCTVLTNEGPQPADVTLFGSATQADLSPWLELELVRGTLPPTSVGGDCTGFTPDGADYGSGGAGVVYRGTLADLPDASAGIADPARWAVGEQHAYKLQIDYSGADPQQGLTTVQSFAWGVTPFDDRPEEPAEGSTPFGDEGPPAGQPVSGAGAPGAGGDDLAARQCTIVSFPSRAYVGARAVSKPKELRRKAKRKRAGRAAVVPSAEAARRSALLRRTKAAAARRSPTLVVRLSKGKGERLSVRVGLRKGTKLSAPRRWRWVRVRVNGSPARSSVRWPFTSSLTMGQLRTGYNQIDISLHRGASAKRIKGLPALLRRSFAFKVGAPGNAAPGTTDCTLG